MEKLKETTKSEIEEFEKEQIYDGLIKLYYYEAKAHLGPLYDKHFSMAMDDIMPLLKKKMEESLYIINNVYKKGSEKYNARKKAALAYLDKSFNQFHKELEESGSDIESKKDLFRKLNVFINIIHNRLNDMHFGETFLGLKADDFKALNYIDTEKPLKEQREIIKNAIAREREQSNR